MKRNTIWGDDGRLDRRLPRKHRRRHADRSNVIYRLWTDTDMSAATLHDNTICERETVPAAPGRSPAARRSPATSASPTQPPTTTGSATGAASTGRPAEEHYGP